MLGRELGNYVIGALLGRGGMGVVYAGKHRFLGTPVAIKLLHKTSSGDANIAQRFFQEAKSALAIDHPNIIRVLDFGEAPDQSLYLVMELLDGLSLSQALAANGRFDEKQAVRTIATVCDALAAAHANGVTHRDLKPDNIFVTRAGEIKVLDFGIAKMADAGAATQTGTLMGTPAYMSPEQCRDAKAAGPPTDIYAVGIILFELLTGRIPFDGDFTGLLVKHLFDAPPRPSSLAPMSPEIEALVLECLEKKPEARPQSMASLRDRLRALDTLESTAATIPPTLVRPPAAPASSWPWVGLAVAALGVGTAIWILERPASTHAAADLSIQVDAARPTRAPLAQTIGGTNPLISRAGIAVERHEVTRQEYATYLASLDAPARRAATPLSDWPSDDRAPPDAARPVTWVTQPQAAAFCRAIEARLPTTEEWTAVAERNAVVWPYKLVAIAAGATAVPVDVESAAGDDIRGVRDLIGNAKEWTDTLSGGFAYVRGADVSTPKADSRSALTQVVQKAIAAPGTVLPSALIAGPRLGFRCVR
jgi:Protein kinase domain/Sulfatase-modifying factor enzyme 1